MSYFKLLFHLITSNQLGRVSRYLLILTCIFTLLSSFLSAYAPFFLNKTIQDLAEKTDYIYHLSIYLLLLSLAKIFQEVRWVTYGKASLKLERIFNIKLSNHLLHLPLSFHNHNKKGSLFGKISKATSSVNSINFSLIFLVLFSVCDILAISFFVLYTYSGMVFLFLFLTVITYVLCMFYFAEKIRNVQKKWHNRSLDTMGFYGDILNNIDLIKQCSAEKTSIDRYNNYLLNMGVIYEKFFTYKTISGFMQGAIIISGLSVILFYSGHRVGLKSLDVGEFVALNIYFFQLLRPLETSSMIYRDIRHFLVAIHSALELFAIEREDAKCNETPLKIDMVPKFKNYNIEFKNVSFSFDNELEVINSFSLKIPHQSKIAIVGESGSGKSTIVKLLFGLYPVTNGKILIGEDNIDNFSTKQLRNLFSYTAQEPMLLNESIEFNLKLVNSDVTDREIDDALKSAEINDFICSIPNGMNTIVGDKGSNISGGEKQRIAIARALLSPAEVFIFDESTSALDPIVEKKVVKNIIEKLSNKTVIFITHRIELAREFDSILVMKNGKLFENGNHDQLLLNKSLYYSLINSKK